ncbi:hypothetical protein CesoFtcFv8_017729 [Champsocephalus esox]|uniref:Uncharacterized protein n=1 Tax=Champsocephalus esox TaxID=159716 RepID=A0AAN8BLF6_9TELE|nr:hypothetical protein CesoFtcFv8_017729 [Champsocephalus esox]
MSPFGGWINSLQRGKQNFVCCNNNMQCGARQQQQQQQRHCQRRRGSSRSTLSVPILTVLVMRAAPRPQDRTVAALCGQQRARTIQPCDDDDDDDCIHPQG